jgi:tetratricopeptide (TPR) repeat protein
MEWFGPLPGEPVAECERKARECDVLICIVAHRYGFEPEKGRGSITRREVEAAKEAGKDVLVWVVADDHLWTEKREQDLLTDPMVLADPNRVAEVATGVAALIEFKAWLRKTFVCDTFTTPDELGRKIAVALSTYSAQRTASSAAQVPKHGEIRIVHALQPAPHFHGRDALVKELTDWIADPASPDRVWSLVAAGGTGKTAIVERVVREMQSGEANVLVWSFYERPETDAFLRECNQLFLGEEEGPAGGRLERLQRGLRDGRPHLIVLDGLERVQEDAGSGRVRGELSDQTLKLLLRVLAAGLGRARALVTSRFPLVDLQDWEKRGYRETRLDDLTPDAALAVLRGWGVVGEGAALRAAALQVGHHALSVAVIGSYLHSFADGRIDEVQSFDLDAVTGEDPKAAKLARVLGFYAERLPGEERELITRLSVFPRGVTLDLLGALVDAGGEIAGMLVNARPRLTGLLTSLKARGLVFGYHSKTDVTWTAHPLLREKFRELLGCPAEDMFGVVVGSLGSGLEKRPKPMPSDADMLDRYERLIEAMRLAGREQDALSLFSGIGGNTQFIGQLGEYERGYRILASFSPTGRPEDLGRTLTPGSRYLLAIDLAFFAHRLGRLEEVRSIIDGVNGWEKPYADSLVWVRLSFSSSLAFNLGRLVESQAFAAKALNTADGKNLGESLSFFGAVSHALGDTRTARAHFATAIASGRRPLISLPAIRSARHHLDLGELVNAHRLVEHGLKVAQTKSQNDELAYFNALLARIYLAEGNDATPHVNEVRRWTSRTGEMESIIEAHLLASRSLLASGDPQAALGEAETGFLHAVACGFGLLRIELLVALARIRLAWPEPPKAIQAAREALDLATHPDCKYAWGEADAAQVWGEAYVANHEPALAHRAFTQALAVRQRIEHPGVAETERWLGMVGA